MRITAKTMTAAAGAGRITAVAGTIARSPAGRDPALDLRRRRGREMGAALLLERADWLSVEERTLVASVYRDNMTIGAIAALSGASPATIRARLRRIISRVNDPCFAFVLAGREGWPAPMRRVATACFLHGWSLRRTASELKMSIGAVRRYRDAAAALCEAQRGRAAAGASGAVA